MSPGFYFYRKKTINIIMMSLTVAAALGAIIPLILIFYYTISKGITFLNLNFFIAMPKPVGEPGGGMATQ